MRGEGAVFPLEVQGHLLLAVSLIHQRIIAPPLGDCLQGAGRLLRACSRFLLGEGKRARASRLVLVPGIGPMEDKSRGIRA